MSLVQFGKAALKIRPRTALVGHICVQILVLQKVYIGNVVVFQKLSEHVAPRHEVLACKCHREQRLDIEI